MDGCAGEALSATFGSRCREEVPGCAGILSVRRLAPRPAGSLRARNVDSDPTEGLYRAGNGGAGTSMHFAIHGSAPRLDRRRRPCARCASLPRLCSRSSPLSRSSRP